MPAANPEDVNLLMGEALSSGNLDAAMDLYEADAAFVPQPGQIVIGPAVRDAVKAFIALKPQLHIEVTSVTRSGDLALLTSSWTLDGTGPDGSALKMSGRGTEVVRQQPDGSWRFAIDNPYGAPEA